MEDTVFNALMDVKIPLHDIDNILDRLLSMGVLVRTDRDAYRDENGEEYDRSQLDYEIIYQEVLLLDDQLALFIEQLRMIQPPQHREWQKLIPQAKGGNKFAFNRLIEMYLRSVVNIALNISKKIGSPIAETIQEGCVGLILAIKKYDIGKQDIFARYYPWYVLRQIQREMAFTINPLVYFPAHIKEKLNRIYEIVKKHDCIKCSNYHLCPALISDAANILNCSNESAKEYVSYFNQLESLETLLDEEPYIFSDHNLLIDDLIDASYADQAKESISRVLNTLTYREKKVLELRYGFYGDSPETLEKVGREFKVTRERIRQIEAKAIRKLRHPSRSKKLRDYID